MPYQLNIKLPGQKPNVVCIVEMGAAERVRLVI